MDQAPPSATDSAGSEPKVRKDLHKRVQKLLATDADVLARMESEGVDADVVTEYAEPLLDRHLKTLWVSHDTLAKAEHRRASYFSAERGLLIAIGGLLMALALFSFVGFLAIVVANRFGIWEGADARGPLAGFAVCTTGAVVLGAVAARRARTRRAKQGLTGAVEEQARAEGELSEQLRHLVLLPAVDAAAVPVFLAPDIDVVSVGDGPWLSSRIDGTRRIRTASHGPILLNIQRTGGATVGLTGTRGVGKSELLRSFCETSASIDSGGRVGIVVATPVAPEPVAFLRVLVRRLAEAVPDYDRHVSRGPIAALLRRRGTLLLASGAAAAGGSQLLLEDRFDASTAGVLLLALASIGLGVVYVELLRGVVEMRIRLFNRRGRNDAVSSDAELQARRRRAARDAVDVVRRIRYLETTSMAVEGTAGIGKMGLKLASGLSLSQLPLTESDLALELEKLVATLGRAGYDVVVGIDELDKLDPGEGAEKFLNAIKVLFPIHGCSFLVTISENAWANFARRGISIRDVFDSSLDTVVVVEHLDFREARRLVRARGEQLTNATVAFCHCLSGGLPRDFLRACRQVGEVNVELGSDRTLGEVASEVLDREFRTRVDGAALELRSDDHLDAAGGFIAELELLVDVSRNGALVEHLRLCLEADREFAALCSGTNPPSSDESTPATALWLQDIRRRLLAYAYFTDTMRAAFTGRGVHKSRRNNESPVEAFEALAKARRRLETDAGAGWRATTAARRRFGLAPVVVGSEEPKKSQTHGRQPARSRTSKRPVSPPRAARA